MSTETTAEIVTDPHAATLAKLAAGCGTGCFSATQFRDNLRLHVAADRLLDVLALLKVDGGFGLLSDLGATDYLGFPGRTEGARFEVHYVLLNLDTSERLVIKVGVDDPDPSLPTATGLWDGAGWMEREVYDMFGIVFAGHADLRRILMPDEFEAFPLRKDYPLRGRGERHNFPRLTRDLS